MEVLRNCPRPPLSIEKASMLWAAIGAVEQATGMPAVSIELQPDQPPNARFARALESFCRGDNLGEISAQVFQANPSKTGISVSVEPPVQDPSDSRVHLGQRLESEAVRVHRLVYGDANSLASVFSDAAQRAIWVWRLRTLAEVASAPMSSLASHLASNRSWAASGETPLIRGYALRSRAIQVLLAAVRVHPDWVPLDSPHEARPLVVPSPGSLTRAQWREHVRLTEFDLLRFRHFSNWVDPQIRQLGAPVWEKIQRARVDAAVRDSARRPAFQQLVSVEALSELQAFEMIDITGERIRLPSHPYQVEWDELMTAIDIGGATVNLAPDQSDEDSFQL